MEINNKISNELFRELLEWSKKENSYSIRDFAEIVGVPYRKIQELSKENDEYQDKFALAKDGLCINTLESLRKDQMSQEKFLRSLYENDWDLRQRFLEEGNIVPDDPDEFDVWAEKQIVIDKRRFFWFE